MTRRSRWSLSHSCLQYLKIWLKKWSSPGVTGVGVRLPTCWGEGWTVESVGWVTHSSSWNEVKWCKELNCVTLSAQSVCLRVCVLGQEFLIFFFFFFFSFLQIFNKWKKNIPIGQCALIYTKRLITKQFIPAVAALWTDAQSWLQLACLDKCTFRIAFLFALNKSPETN